MVTQHHYLIAWWLHLRYISVMNNDIIVIIPFISINSHKVPIAEFMLPSIIVKLYNGDDHQYYHDLALANMHAGGHAKEELINLCEVISNGLLTCGAMDSLKDYLHNYRVSDAEITKNNDLYIRLNQRD